MGTKKEFPPWLKKKVSHSTVIGNTEGLLQRLELNTVCQEAQCPNISECFSHRTATFMILGRTCTRRCTFCAVTKAPSVLSHTLPLDPDEPKRIAEAAVQLGLRHSVITSVTRDDLPDGGALQFVRTIEALRKHLPDLTIEVLIPDFKGDDKALELVLEAVPDVLNHNLETVPRLYPLVRPGADYPRSLRLLRRVKEIRPGVLTKSGIMVGLGETGEEVLMLMADLRKSGCDILTVGQYLQPTPAHLPVRDYIELKTYEFYKARGLAAGFKDVAAGPWVRSSYQAGEVFLKASRHRQAFIN